MYLNFEKLEKSKLLPKEFFYLLAIKNKADFYTSKIPDNVLSNLSENGFVTVDKSIKITKSGKELLKDLSTPTVDEDDEKIFVWLENFYIKNGKGIGNATKTKRYISEFKNKSGIEKNKLVILCKSFLEDDDNMQYNNILEYAFYKPTNPYQTSFKLEDSRLYQFYLRNKEHFDKEFEKY